MLRGILYAIISACSYGFIPLFSIPMSSEGMDSFSILTYRFILSACMLAIIALCCKQSLRICKKDLFKFLGIGFVYSVAAATFFIPLEMMDSGIVATVQFCYPVFVILGMSLFFKEPLRPSTLVASFVICLGVGIFSWQDSAHVRIDGFAMLLTIFSATQMALYVMGIQVARFNVQNQIITSMYILGTAGFFSYIYCLLDEGFAIPTTMAAWGNLGIFALITGVLSTVALVKAVQYIGPSLTSILSSLEPVTVMIIGVFIIGEGFSVQNLLGASCIVGAATYVAIAAKMREEKLKKLLEI